MSHQIIVNLTDVEYAALALEAAKSGKATESILHELLTRHIRPSSGHVQTNRRVQEYLYQEGLIDHIASNEPDEEEVENERTRLAHLFAQGKSASDMVIEDRGPR